MNLTIFLHPQTLLMKKSSPQAVLAQGLHVFFFADKAVFVRINSASAEPTHSLRAHFETQNHATHHNRTSCGPFGGTDPQ